MNPLRANARFEALDSLRGMAALLVVVYHLAAFFGWQKAEGPFDLVSNSYLFVDLFFLISGFVISHGYTDKIREKKDFAEFLWARFWRVYPLHFFMLMLFLAWKLVSYWKLSRQDPSADFWALAEFEYLGTNLLLIHSMGVHDSLTWLWNFPSWSISVEFYTYVFFGLMLLANAMRPPAKVLTCLITILGAYAVLLPLKDSIDVTYDLGIFRCLIGFCMGSLVHSVFLSVRSSVEASSWWASVLQAIAILSALVFVAAANGRVTFLAPLVFGVVVLAMTCLHGLPNRILASRPLAYLGKISYSIYMVHVFVCMLVLKLGQKYFGQSDLLETLAPALALILVLLASDASFRLIEEPFRKFGKRMLSAHRARAASPQGDAVRELTI